jgi:hypothetical protein
MARALMSDEEAVLAMAQVPPELVDLNTLLLCVPA